jgi:uncharacterized protein YjbI with pentapeptide repeats
MTDARYWDYPPPGPAALAMLAPSPVRDRLKALLEEADAYEIEEWLAQAAIPEEVEHVLRRGLRGQDVYDAVEAASLVWEDRCGTYTSCVVRRQNEELLYQAWQDGELLGECETESELSGEEIRNLMVTGDIDDDDYSGKAGFTASSDFHEVPDYEGWSEEPDVETIVASGVIEGKKFPGRDFSSLDLTGIRASRANLEGACFYRASLTGADFHAAALRHADFRCADLRYAVLHGADLEGAQLHGADLRGANLRFANLRGADLHNALTEGADFTGADRT